MCKRLPAHPQSVAPLRRAVVEFARHCGATDRQREDIALAVSEAVSNTVVHAYVGYAKPGNVEVRATASADSLQILISDEGRGLVARDDSPGLGLGLGLIDLVTQQLELSDATPGLRVQMTFAIT